MGKEEDLLTLAKADLKASKLLLTTANDEALQNIAAYHTQQSIEKVLKSLKESNGSPAGIGHDIYMLAEDAIQSGAEVPEWIKEKSMEISKWATTIRYNSRFKTNRDEIMAINEMAEEWIKGMDTN